VSRYLFVVPPLVGHTFPTVAVARELAARGHGVAWAGYADAIGGLLPDDAEIVEAGPAPGGGTWLANVQERSRGLRGAAAFRFLWEDFLVPLAAAMVPGVDAAADKLAPDVLVVDQQAVAGAIVARRRRLPWATSATTSAELADTFALMPKLGAWVRQCLRDLERGFGVPAAGTGDLRFSEHLVLAFTTEALAGPGTHLPGGRYPDHYAFVGPSIGARPSGADFPWDWLDPDRDCVLVSLGTVNRDAGRRFLAAAAEALAPLGDDVQGILVAPADLLAGPPDNVLVREFVPQLDLLGHLAAVVCHAGHNTVCESLAHGLPLVVAPIRDDQPVVAQQVVDAGAGVRVRYGRVGPAELRAAVTAVRTDPGYREAAARIRESFRAAGGAAAAADRLEKLR
jgi:MGT family glycosyltransferase